jgi:hypothetical protein
MGLNPTRGTEFPDKSNSFEAGRRIDLDHTQAQRPARFSPEVSPGAHPVGQPRGYDCKVSRARVIWKLAGGNSVFDAGAGPGALPTLIETRETGTKNRRFTWLPFLSRKKVPLGALGGPT